VDEISACYEQNYLHLVSALDGLKGLKVLYVGKGYKKEDLEEFWT